MMNQVKALLIDMGWVEVFFSGFVLQYFDTAAGKKVCTLRSTSFGEKTWVSAEYFSEGRNVCSRCLVTLSTFDSLEELMSKLNAFDQSVKDCINESYARGLYLRHNFINETVGA